MEKTPNDLPEDFEPCRTKLSGMIVTTDSGLYSFTFKITSSTRKGKVAIKDLDSFQIYNEFYMLDRVNGECVVSLKTTAFPNPLSISKLGVDEFLSILKHV